MKSLMLIACFYTGLFSSAVFANGVMTMDGKITGFDDQTYRIANGPVTYVIKKSALNKAQLAELKKRHSGETVRLQITTEAIERIDQNVGKSTSQTPFSTTTHSQKP